MTALRHVMVLVEGQTEQGVLESVFAPVALTHSIYIQPITVITSDTSHGANRGGGNWRKYDDHLRRLLKNTHLSRVGLLIDFYGYPRNAPGYIANGKGESYRQSLEQALRDHFEDPRFRPLVVKHEIEALALASISAGHSTGAFSTKALKQLVKAVEASGGPEEVNNGPDTSPSKRIHRVCRKYRKVQDGRELAERAGAEELLRRCPTFAAWWKSLLEDAPS
ncbi:MULTISPECIES: DUF4276 family protein [unclassified Actinomyces]|uniref:DUF4276 family protein n=1 Tax=unclassified Actinomyces TaxID=2609248 RepID=UPI0013A6F6CD|nr:MULTISPECIES: DUF4276 family protein [unclassified Actinomyces]MBW3068894.1 DUF4276 family protein [Actinomyces sp. 594]NDR52556.1 DUF4276 family protein [Actinomyces sp. 565]